MTRVKICGMTRLEDAQLAVKLGAWAVGFVFVRESPRYIKLSEAERISAALGGTVIKVGVVVNFSENEILQLAPIVDVLQFHGDESVQFCEEMCKKSGKAYFKAIGPKSPEELSQLQEFSSAQAVLIDAASSARSPGERGGTGQLSDWKLARDAQILYRKIVLAGGLRPENVAQAVREVKPYAVDVSSGVEAHPGKKDPEKLLRFFEEVKRGSS